MTDTTPDVDTTPNLVQPIVVLLDPTDPPLYGDVVLAGAQASLAAFDTTPNDPAWAEWLSGPFTKTVRRAKPKDFDKIVKVVEGPVIMVGSAQAVAGVPLAYAEFPRELKRAQVSGTDVAHPESFSPYAPLSKVVEGCVDLLVDASLGMTTGKETAQVSHAAWMARQHGFDTFTVIPIRSHDSFERWRTSKDAAFVVRDNGLTEFDGPTYTVVGIPSEHNRVSSI